MAKILRDYYLLVVLVLIIGVFGKSVFANERPAPRLLHYIGLPVAVPGLDKWLGVSKPGANSIEEWRRLFAGKSKAQQIKDVNAWVNSRINYREDGSDRWASPEQSLARGFGDCEDFAILKYYILKSIGFREDELFFLVANDLVVRTKHSVLLVNADGQEYVLDNFTSDIVTPSAAVNVLKPEFAYSGTMSWLFGIKKSP